MPFSKLSPPQSPRSELGSVGRILLLIGIAGALLVGVLGVGLWTSFRQAETRAEAQADSWARMLAREAENLLRSADLALTQIASLAANTDWSNPEQVWAAESNLERLQALLPYAPRLWIWDATGGLTATSGYKPDPTLNVADRPYFQAHRQAGAGLYIGEPMRGRLDNRLVLVLSRRVQTAGGGFGGVVSLSLDPEILARFYQSLEVMADTTFLWVKPDLTVLLRQPALPEGKVINTADWEAFARSMAAQPEGGRHDYVSRFDGVARVGFFRPVGDYPLYVSLGVSRAAIFDAWVAAMWPHFVLTALALSGLAAAAIYALRGARREGRYRHELAEVNSRLLEAKTALEDRVRERTAELEALVRQKEVLFREVNHRVKNSLQTVAALLQTQGRLLAGREAQQQFGEAVGRVMAVARVHERLYQSDEVRTVEVLGYARSLCADLERSLQGAGSLWQIQVTGEPFPVPTDKAVPLGLILNELVTNAAKHGRPVAEDGNGWSIEVRLTREKDGQGQLSVRDFGPGLPDQDLPRRTGSLGLRLIATLVEQLCGEMRVERPEPGTRVIVQFPFEPPDPLGPRS